MTHKIFLSHNHKDKPLVEAIAVKLADIFGQDQVFYDSWSIQPGDGIIDRMNQGLDAPEFVFFFVSASSLASGMVKLEWQNALYKASNGITRIIPVRLDGSAMPAVLTQTLYIDMHTIGLEAAIAQIVSVTQGNASFTPQHKGFSNLTYSQTRSADGLIEVSVKASHLMEPNPQFAFATRNTEAEIGFEMKNKSPFAHGFIPNSTTVSGVQTNAIFMRPLAASLTPGNPFRALFSKKTEAEIEILTVLHQRSENEWVEVPKAPR